MRFADTVGRAAGIVHGCPGAARRLGATGTDVLARAERLAAPAAARNRWNSRLLLTAATFLITGGPLILAALTASSAMWCHPIAI